MSEEELNRSIASNYTAHTVPDEQNKFLLKYDDGSTPDLEVELALDEVRREVKWKNVPLALGLALDNFNYVDVERDPFTCIEVAINQIKKSCQELRPKEEIEAKI